MDDLDRLLDDIALAGAVVAPSWPLSSTIAVNPLAGFEDRPFTDALDEASLLFGSRGTLSMHELRLAHRAGRVTRRHLGDALDRVVPDLGDDDRSLLLADLVDGTPDPEPHRQLLTVVEQRDADRGTSCTGLLLGMLADRCARDDLPPGRAGHPIEAADVHRLGGRLLDDLARLGVPASSRRSYLERHLTALPGWVSHLRWRERQGEEHLLLRFLAAAVGTEADLVDGRTWCPDPEPPTSRPEASLAQRAEAVAELAGGADAATVTRALGVLPGWRRRVVWQDAYERAVHDPLLALVAPPAPAPAGATRPAAQVVCCIDVRAEPLRRHLEALGPYETAGYAGFFGLAARVEPSGGGEGTDQCPVLLSPTTSISVSDGSPAGRRLRAGADDGWRATLHHPVAPLALAEGAGWLAGPLAALRTVWPGWAALGRPEGTAQPPTTPDISTVPLDVRVEVVAALLRTGIGERAAPIIVLCAHTSNTANNPTESGLRCGACGGHGGEANAAAVASMANDPEVRAALAGRGVPIPEDTWFTGAVHDTAADRVTILGRAPASHTARLAALEADLARAAHEVSLERGRHLPGGDGSVTRTRRRARDWAEPVPELGLAGNAVFIVGPRSMTSGADLGGRAFLHSYEPDGDPSGDVLAGILTAPLVVAQWINAQYHFSTTDPEVFGSGSKALHNVVGDVGVLSGPGGDLRRGLALQSVRAGDRLLHEPVRLLAVVQGRRAHVDAAIAGSTTLRQLVENQWIHLVVREPAESGWQQRSAAGWEPRDVGTEDRATTEVPA